MKSHIFKMVRKGDDPKPLVWRGSSKSDFMAFPPAVQREMGYALFQAQMGERHPTMARTLKGFGGGAVVEIRESHEGNAYRGVYTVRYSLCASRIPEEVEIRHCNTEASNDVDRTAPEGVDPREGEIVMAKTPAAKDPARNVWLQLGFPDAEEHFLKAELVFRLDKAIKSLGLTQRVAAQRIGATQPELSKILGGKFTEVSLERLMRFLTALGYHIEIKIGARRPDRAGEVTVRDGRRTAA